MLNVKLYGAKGNGIKDDTQAIQRAIDNSAKAPATIFFPKGVYRITSSIKSKTGISFKGEGPIDSVILAEDTVYACIDQRNTITHHTSVEKLGFIKESGDKFSYGILASSAEHIYSTALAAYRDLRFEGLSRGIGVEWEDEIGLFDCVFDNIHCFKCWMGLDLAGSGNTVIHPYMWQCDYGFVIASAPGGESMTGGTILGGVFALNRQDFYVRGPSNRPLSVTGTWFEQAAEGVLDSKEALNVKFDKCLLDTHAQYSISATMSSVVLEDCTLTKPAQGVTIK